LARSCRIASIVVSTWAKTPRTLAVVVVAISVMAPVSMLQRVREHLLHLDDRERWQHADEAEEQEEEPGKRSDDDRRVGDRRIVRAARVAVEVVPESRDDDVEALEPHADEHEQ